MEHKPLNIIIENKIPFISGLLDDVANVNYLSPYIITPAAVKDADAMIIRTRTRCNADLLDGSRCRFIATATIGTDHIDLDYCRRQGITVVNAPGCNAPAVAQYVFASILHILGENVSGLTLGVTGVGHVGSIVAEWGRQLGMRVLLCDPPRAEMEGRDNFDTLQRLAEECDIITFHTPLTKSGAHPTFHLADDSFVDSLARKPILINSARGPVFDTRAILRGIDNGKISNVIVDCWENEPCIDKTLLDKAAIATPHIAGYSSEGKIRATQAAVKALTEHFNLPKPEFKHNVAPGAAKRVDAQSISTSYSPAADTAALKSRPEQFESLRNEYHYRNEVR